MRINIYAEELYDPEAAPRERRMERAEKVADTGRTFFGARLFLLSPEELHDDHADDDRSAITIWGRDTRLRPCCASSRT